MLFSVYKFAPGCCRTLLTNRLEFVCLTAFGGNGGLGLMLRVFLSKDTAIQPRLLAYLFRGCLRLGHLLLGLRLACDPVFGARQKLPGTLFQEITGSGFRWLAGFAGFRVDLVVLPYLLL